MMSNILNQSKHVVLQRLTIKKSGRGHNPSTFYLFTSATAKTKNDTIAGNNKGNNDYKNTMHQGYKMIG